MEEEIIEIGYGSQKGSAPLKKARSALRKLRKTVGKLKDFIKNKSEPSIVVMVVEEVKEDAGRAREAANSLPESMKKSFLSTIKKITAKAAGMFSRFRNKAEVIATVDESGRLEEKRKLGLEIIEPSLATEKKHGSFKETVKKMFKKEKPEVIATIDESGRLEEKRAPKVDIVEQRKEASSILKTLRNAVKDLRNSIKNKAPASEIEVANTKINEVVEKAKSSTKLLSLPNMIKEKFFKWIGKIIAKVARDIGTYNKQRIEMPKTSHFVKYQSFSIVSGVPKNDTGHKSFKTCVVNALGDNAKEYKIDGDTEYAMFTSRKDGGQFSIRPEGIDIRGGIIGASNEMLQDVLRAAEALYKSPVVIYLNPMDKHEGERIAETAKNMNPPVDVKTFDTRSRFENAKKDIQKAAEPEVAQAKAPVREEAKVYESSTPRPSPRFEPEPEERERMGLRR